MLSVLLNQSTVCRSNQTATIVCPVLAPFRLSSFVVFRANQIQNPSTDSFYSYHKKVYSVVVSIKLSRCPHNRTQRHILPQALTTTAAYLLPRPRTLLGETDAKIIPKYEKDGGIGAGSVPKPAQSLMTAQEVVCTYPTVPRRPR